MNYKITQGDNRDVLKTYPDNYFDSVITDPPYGIDFLGKNWDANTGALETYQECLRVLKPGGYLLAFSAARTYHHLAITVEQAGFEIRDQLMWIYASGFPKAQDIGKAIQRRQGVEEFEYRDKTDGYNLKNEKGFTENNDVGYGKMKGIAVPTSPEAKQWSGWKTALKPAHEPIVMARKPFKGSTIDNVLAHGVGALNIDATRIDDHGELKPSTLPASDPRNDLHYNGIENNNAPSDEKWIPNEQGRFPSNVMGEIDGYQKFFYCPKVSRKERHIGFDTDKVAKDGGTQMYGPEQAVLRKGKYDAEYPGNNHPTVKPVELMKYLIKLTTPPNSRVLDPFTGSGSTGMAAVELGHEFHGMDLDPNYVKIAETRIEAWNAPDDHGLDPELFE